MNDILAVMALSMLNTLLRLDKPIFILFKGHMAKNIVRPGPDFDFSSLTLNQPYAIQGGSYFTKLLSGGQQLYVQTPKCFTRGGIVKSGSKIYSDLLFAQEDSQFIGWLGQLETTLHGLIFDKRDLWFHNELDLTDIETAFSSPVKVVKSGASYLVRCNLGKAQGLGFDSPVRIFNENEVDLKITDVKPESPIISIIELSGVRFSSRSFHLDINIKQMMVIQARDTFDRCMIDLGNGSQTGGLAETIMDSDQAGVRFEDQPDSDEEEHEHREAEQDQAAQDPAEQDPAEQDPAEQDQAEQDPAEQVQAEQDQAEQDQAEQVQAEQDQAEQKEAEPEQQKQGEREQAEPTPAKQTQAARSQSSQEPAAVTPRSEEAGGSKAQPRDESLEEVVFNAAELRDTVSLKDPSEVYMELYIKARDKAKQAKKAAIEAYLEARNIKQTYLLDELEESDEDSEFEVAI
jgi:hypothetical protein